jgi:hypothetical protein
MEEREKLEEEEDEGYVCSPGPTKEGGNLRKPSGASGDDRKVRTGLFQLGN